MTEDELKRAVRDSIARLNAMTPEERRAMWEAQGDSWVRGEMALTEYERKTRR